MNTASESRTQSLTTVRFVAVAVFLVMTGSGYAISTYGEGADKDGRFAASTGAGEQPRDYFPAQHVNQGGEVEEHIQAY